MRILSPKNSPFKIPSLIFLLELYLKFTSFIVAIYFLPSKKLIFPFLKLKSFRLISFLEKFLYSLSFSKSKLISAFFNSILVKLNFFLFDKL